MTRTHSAVPRLHAVATMSAGTHTLFGRFITWRPAAEVLGDWLEAQPIDDEYDQLDLQRWLESVTEVNAHELVIFEETWSNDATIAERRAWIDVLASRATSGDCELQLVTESVDVVSWQVRAGAVLTGTEVRRRVLPPPISPEHRDRFAKRHDPAAN
ncbi:hypothetical protein BH11MYX1_BH11MYX1_31700 [soil metagenome]